MIIGRSIPTTPRVGMAVATAIIAKIVTNSPRPNAHSRRTAPSTTCALASSTNNKKNAAGVADESPSRDPCTTMLP